MITFVVVHNTFDDLQVFANDKGFSLTRNAPTLICNFLRQVLKNYIAFLSFRCRIQLPTFVTETMEQQRASP